MDVMSFFITGALVVGIASIAIIAYVFYKWRTDDVISVDNVGAEAFYTLKRLSEDKKVLEQVGREHDAGVYNDLK